MRRLNRGAQRSCWLLMLLATVCLSPAEPGDERGVGVTGERHPAAAIRIVDQYGRQVPSGKQYTGSEIFDVTVGPVGHELTFAPDTINIGVGATVRWTWESDFHSVTSGTSCTADGQFCSPDNMNCDAGMLNDTGFVYEFTFTQPGRYQYFCAIHCVVGMTGVVNVLPAARPRPTPPPRP